MDNPIYGYYAPTSKDSDIPVTTYGESEATGFSGIAIARHPKYSSRAGSASEHDLSTPYEEYQSLITPEGKTDNPKHYQVKTEH